MVTFVGARLREEREALCLSQEAFGRIGGVTKQAQIKYEKGERHPDTRYLAAIAAAGADVLYILTGQRSSALPPAPAAPPITEGERTLLALYHAAPAQVQEGVRTTLGAFGPAADQRNTKGRAA
ncbi:XRE family transcriptional regulator [Vandammella animalimorsus]|uniref:XRE family transcriptional regulator n=1 Tax=Vandammella animalimorsus TaxID=2029117 RepID=A0A3M6RVD7_9BURK|nr:helix-turn-helix transcriptional regulator [Vandammella animalimorsus]RMX18884.1 XRE family transcriptional regulator [Vandammella animalimorsus]